MKKQKKFIVTNSMQKVAVDILQDLEIILMRTSEFESKEDVFKEILTIIKDQSRKYFLCKDPFTSMVCSSNDYADASREYERQTAIEKFGHCDWLD